MQPVYLSDVPSERQLHPEDGFMSRQPYDTNLNDAKWALLEEKLPLVRKST